jgi:hypothetical protein
MDWSNPTWVFKGVDKNGRELFINSL